MTIIYGELRLETVLSSEFGDLFDCVKQGIFEHVDNVFGWDDEFQRNRLSNDYHRFLVSLGV